MTAAAERPPQGMQRLLSALLPQRTGSSPTLSKHGGQRRPKQVLQATVMQIPLHNTVKVTLPAGQPWSLSPTAQPRSRLELLNLPRSSTIR